jgi:signal transduction histidine kinase
VLLTILALGTALPGTAAYVLSALVALFTVASLRSAGAVAVGTAALLLSVVAHRLAWGESIDFMRDIVPACVEVTSVVALGLYVGTRRAHIASLHDRAARLERERELLAERAVAEERVRIAQELHDVVGHNVVLMVVQAQALGATAGSAQVATATDAIADLGRNTMDEMRRTLRLLRGADDGSDPRLEPQPGLDEVAGLIEQARAAGVDVRLRVEGERRPLPAGVELAVHRVVQEALTNVVRHARGAAAHVVLRHSPDAVELLVRDEGVSAEAPRDGGHGLIGMRERIAIYGGRLHVGPRVCGGWEVRARIPVLADEARR